MIVSVPAWKVNLKYTGKILQHQATIQHNILSTGYTVRGTLRVLLLRARVQLKYTYNISKIHWKPRGFMMPTLPSMAATEVVIMITSGATIDGKVGIMIFPPSYSIIYDYNSRHVTGMRAWQTRCSSTLLSNEVSCSNVSGWFCCSLFCYDYIVVLDGIKFVAQELYITRK